MGYELIVTKQVETREDSSFGSYIAIPDNADDSQYWFGCGWDLTALCHDLMRLGEAHDEGTENAYAVVPVSAMKFIVDIEDRISKDENWCYYRRLHDIDGLLADDWYHELTARERADMALSFYPDTTTGMEYSAIEVIRFLYHYSIDRYPYFVTGLADFLKQAVDEDVKQLYVWGA